MNRQVLRWDVPIDDNAHAIGGGKVLMVGCRMVVPGIPTPRVEIWTEEIVQSDVNPTPRTRHVTVVGTGHRIPDGFEHHVGSVVDPNPDIRLVWHVYERVGPSIG